MDMLEKLPKRNRRLSHPGHFWKSAEYVFPSAAPPAALPFDLLPFDLCLLFAHLLQPFPQLAPLYIPSTQLPHFSTRVCSGEPITALGPQSPPGAGTVTSGLFLPDDRHHLSLSSCHVIGVSSMKPDWQGSSHPGPAPAPFMADLSSQHPPLQKSRDRKGSQLLVILSLCSLLRRVHACPCHCPSCRSLAFRETRNMYLTPGSCPQACLHDGTLLNMRERLLRGPRFLLPS